MQGNRINNAEHQAFARYAEPFNIIAYYRTIVP
jgi:hypothetical protein